jgi:hypothetical protein
MIQIDQHLLILDLDRVDVDWFRGGQAEGAPATEVESGPVEVALDGSVLDVPVAQGDVPVAADVVDGEVFALVEHDGDLVFVDGERNLRTQLVEGSDGYEGH